MNMKKLLKNTILTCLVLIILAVIGAIIYDKATVNNKYYISESNIEIPIFVYHSIVKNDSEVEFDYMQTTSSVFENQIVGLQKAGYKFITYKDLQKYKNGEIQLSKKSCILTFDDGYETIYQNVFPIAQKYNIPFTIFIITDNMDNAGIITWEEAKEMQDSGLVTIASHSTNHPEFTTLSVEEAVNNVNSSYEEIEEKLGKQNPKIFTYPYGLYTEEEVIALEKEGYIQNLTDNKINKSKQLDLVRLHRCYPLSDSINKMRLKILYRSIRYN